MRLLLAMGALLVVAACGGSDPPEASPASSPTPTRTATSAPALEPAAAVVDALMRALDAGDCKAARKLVVTPSELGCDVVEQSKDSFADEGIDLDEVTYRVGAVHDASATVRITWGNGYPTESYDVQRIGSRWKVVFDSAA
ncbi:hypothetical protein [Aeromicrobium ginsengisoli]|uniref:DUF4878 domain-containing protein n=1 Tax=Aeromicrobium ginsengisoli TaxID=363867 RepID=A0A5M4FDP7_9ACTN|nr:hypothetical protein [Aeromicrobium ginsengisoli]KAA1397338.1 hypothetical protein ESP70_008085 [Aeromicrobium ginsengisoli]